MLSAGSTATLDLLDVLSSCPSERLLATGLDLLPAVESSHSFDNIPPFPATAKPLIFIPDLGTALLRSPPASSPDATRPLITSPTGPRLKAMVLESVTIGVWTESVFPASDSCLVNGSDDGTANLEGSNPPEWIAEGSLFSPKNFSALFRKGLSRAAEELSSHDDRDSNPDLTLVDSDASVTSSLASLSEAPGESSAQVDAPLSQPMPTIMVSSSTAALPLSLGSTHDLQPELPLAVRRGKKLPPALSLRQSKHANDDDYPDIPTPFLGSPTASTPSAEQPLGPSTFTMGLSAMCADLRSRLPSPPPFSPTEPAPPRPASRMGSTSALPWQDSVASDLDDEEWAFARDLVADWHGTKKTRVELSPPPSPAGELPYASDAASPSSESSFDVAPPSLESSSESSGDEEDVVRTPADVKLTRRKTVIIQAPDSSSLVRPEQTEKVLSLAADGGADHLVHAFDDPVPFETPSAMPGHLSCELGTPTPPGSRPASTASTRPVRGILKEKKSVRFSTVDLFHEYTSAANPRDALAPQCAAPASLALALALAPQAERPISIPARRPTSTVHRSSPLRASYAPTELATAGAPDARLPARARQDPPLYAGRTAPKHPAIRALARASSTSGPQAPRAGAGPGGAVVGAPRLQSPSPVLRERALNLNARQPQPPSPTRESMAKSPHGRGGVPATLARRVLRATSIPPRPRLEQDENARRRSQPAAGSAASCGAAAGARAGVAGVGAGAGAGVVSKSRMSAPLRSIFTKLRT